MGLRLDLQTLFEELIDSDNVYFQPPETKKMEYPCIRYERDFILSEWADGESYKRENRYLVTVIDRNPDSLIPDKVAALPKCVADRFFTADNLNHYVFKLFF